MSKYSPKKSFVMISARALALTSLEIKAPPERVWEMLAFDRLPEWNVGYNEVKSVDYTSEVSIPEDKYRVGATAHGIPKKQGESIKFEITRT